jgi:hypothetical protein
MSYSKCPRCGYHAFDGVECFDCGYRARSRQIEDGAGSVAGAAAGRPRFDCQREGHGDGHAHGSLGRPHQPDSASGVDATARARTNGVTNKKPARGRGLHRSPRQPSRRTADMAMSRVTENSHAAAAPRTFGDLKQLIASEPRGDWPSRVNPCLTHTQALEVLEKGLATHADNQLLDDTRRGLLYARNVLRECRSRNGGVR